MSRPFLERWRKLLPEQRSYVLDVLASALRRTERHLGASEKASKSMPAPWDEMRLARALEHAGHADALKIARDLLSVLGKSDALGTLECPCCGDIGAEPVEDGFLYNGQQTTCGCGGIVSLGAGSGPVIVVDDKRPCPRCDKK